MTDDIFKALRPDGTDFATGTTKPRKGRWMPRIEGELIMCERGYHVSDTVGEVLIGGSWPCKLARVEIPDGEWDHQGHKLVVSTYRVVEWLPAWQALGPNGQEVDALIERVGKMTADEAMRLATAWYAARDVARDVSREAAADAARGVARYAALGSAWYAARGAAWYAAGYAARHAAGALVVRDLISQEHFDTLYGPWKEVIGDAS